MSKFQNWKEYKLRPNHSVVGKIRVLSSLYSPQLNNNRNLLVYLPATYNNGQEEQYPVIYMHDGQNIFDNATSFSGEWHADESMERRGWKQKQEAILVGIPNIGKSRMDEYSPFRDKQHGGGKGDLYLQFLVETIKPIIDHDFRTLPDKEHTAILGSSMGGLISLYAFFKQPDIFGMCGAMSPAFWFANEAIYNFVEESTFNTGKIYLDNGTREYADFFSDLILLRQRSRNYYGRIRHMKRILVKKGYRLRHELLHVEETNAKHSEASWARRLPGVFDFFLNP